MDEITRQYIRENLNADVPTLALRKAPVGTDVSLALRQIEARQLLSKKVPKWSQNEDLLFPAHLSVEQCSSEATAQYKSNLLKGDTFVDLTGGLGIDTYYLSQSFQQAEYVERQPELCDLARHNFKVLNAPVTVCNATAEEFVSHCETKSCFYLDPARRDAHGRKTVSIADCTPNVLAMQDILLQKATTVMIKLSPMLDISNALGELKCVKEVHVLAVNNECKELVFMLEQGFSGQPVLIGANLLTHQSVMRFTIEEERECRARFADDIGYYLYEPNVALMKAGCYKLLTERYPVLKLHKNSHLYTSNSLLSDFPGRCFKVENWAPYNKKTLKKGLLQDINRANLAVRNFPIVVDELRKALSIKEGGEVYLFATTIHGDEKVIIKTKKPLPAGTVLC